MTSLKLKRPSSARRNIKQEMFSQFVSSNRLRHIQSHLVLVEENYDQVSKKPDAILCVLGIDGRYNDGTRELVNYLLFGFFDVRKHELERSGFAEEVIDDLMFVIRHQSVDIYCNPINYHYLLPYVAHWRNLHIHCLGEEKYKDEEKAEDFKIQSFLAMVKGCHCVGIPFCSSGQKIGFEPMAIEKWPIVQAYALEGVGDGGFFTMKYQVMDLSDKLHHMYQYMDPVAMETLVTEQLPLFERQWNSLLAICEMERSERTKTLTEGKACEPLSTYFSHGRVVTAKGGRSIPIRHPFVLFGTHTCKEDLDNAHKTGISYNSDPQSTGVNGVPAHHMICQAVSPRGPLCCTRTYFFDTPVAPIPMSGSSGNIQNPPEHMTDARLLQEIYLALVRAVIKAIEMYSMTLSAIQAEKTALVTLQEVCERAELPLNPDLFRNKKFVEFHLSGFDNQNRAVSMKEGESIPFVKTLRLTTYDIPSLEHHSQVLGSVSFAESFMESSINVLFPDESRELNGDCVILTSSLPRLISWPIHDDSASLVSEIESNLEADKHPRFGQKLVDEEPAHVVVEGDPDIIYRTGALHLYEHGLVFSHPHVGVCVLPKQEVSAIHFYDGDSPSVPALLILSYKEHVRHYLPLQLRTDTYRLVVALLPKTKAYKRFFSNVLPLWKLEENRPNLELLSELPSELIHVHQQLLQEHQVATVLPSSVSLLQQAKCKMPDLTRFLQHLDVSSIGHSAVSSKHLRAVLGQPFDAGSFNDTNEMIVTILCGAPGSHKDDLCTTLTGLAKEENRWVVIKHALSNTELYDPETLQSSLAAAWTGQRRRKPGHSQKKMKALIVSPGFTDIVEIVQTIASHPDPDIAGHVKIGAVTVCIDPANAFMEDAYTLPKLLDQCAQGWVNNIVFTGPSTMDKNADLQSLQHLVRAINSNVALLLAPRGEVTRSTDIELILSEAAFSQDSLVRARYLSCPGWWLGQFDSGAIYPPMEEEMLTFHQPLEKSRLMSKLKSLKTAHCGFPFTNNVYYIKGRVSFTDSSQLYDIRHTVLSGSITLTPTELLPSPPSAKSNGLAPQSCFLMFIGCSLNNNQLKDWMRGCVKPKPEKKVYRTRKSLSRIEVNRIHKENHLEQLPEGWYYNGTQFVSLGGDRSDTHPNLEQFLEQYLDKTNQEAKNYNKRLTQLDHHDLFE